MNFEQLKIFITVVECRSFTKAAEMLYISHSTTSRNVAALEESLGVKLLVRDNRSVRLTPAGEILYAEGVKLLRKVNSVSLAVRNAGLGLMGRLSVVSVNLYTPELFGGYKEFGLRYPEVVLAMYHRDISDIWAQVESGAADIGVTFSYTLPEELGDFETHIVASDKFCIVAPEGHPIAKRSAVRIEDIRGLNYISVDSQNLDYLHRGGERAKLPNIGGDLTVVPTIESLFLQVRSGKGLSMVPYPIAREYGEGCSIIDIVDMDTSFDVVMLFRRDNPNPSLPLFIETMMAHTASGGTGR